MNTTPSPDGPKGDTVPFLALESHCMGRMTGYGVHFMVKPIYGVIQAVYIKVLLKRSTVSNQHYVHYFMSQNLIMQLF